MGLRWWEMVLGFTEVLMILLVVLILFGPQKLPELAREMGRAVREFKTAMNSEEAPKKGKRMG
jgi:TatA/E family protein of Tat protein translocase